MQCETNSDGCCGTESRRFLTKEEKLEKLGKYKQWLDSEAKGVSEAMQKLAKA